MKISDRAVRVGIDRIVGRVGAHLLGLTEGGVVRGLGAQVRLRQRPHRILQQLDGYPVPVATQGGAPGILGADDRAVMAVVHGEFPVFRPGALFERNGDLAHPQFS